MVKFRLPPIASILTTLIIVCVLHPGVLCAQAPSPQYTITDLGVFTARRMNDSAQVVGTMVNGRQTAMLYKDGVLRDISPPNADVSAAHDINNLGDVVGEVFFCTFVGPNCTGRNTKGFIYRNNTYTIMSTLGGDQSRAFGINDSRQVTGYSETLPSGQDHAFIFQNGTFQDLGPSIGSPTSYSYSINAGGQVAGFANGAFLYTNGSAQVFEQNGSANDVNNAGQVVGNFGGNDDGSGRAFLFSGGIRQDLGTLPLGHNYSSGYAINNLGQVVGNSSVSWFTNEDERAFIYSQGVMQDLNTLIPAGSGWMLKWAADINDSGQIVGNGTLNGQDHAFLLTPTQPMLMTDPNTSKALTLESISFLAGPFGLTTPRNLGSDNRTRITLVTRNVEIIAGEQIAPPVVTAEDVNHNVFVLPVEFAGKIPGAGWLTQIVVRLPDGLTTGGDLQVSVSFRGRTSNRGAITMANPGP